MKELLAGIVLILVIGVGGFIYRNEVERSVVTPPFVFATSTVQAVATTTVATSTSPVNTSTTSQAN